jgi:hypothetical protein
VLVVGHSLHLHPTIRSGKRREHHVQARPFQTGVVRTSEGVPFQPNCHTYFSGIVAVLRVPYIAEGGTDTIWESDLQYAVEQIHALLPGFATVERIEEWVRCYDYSVMSKSGPGGN